MTALISSMAEPAAQLMFAAMHYRPFLAGQFLLAMPGMRDPSFDHAVIAMCAHDADGAIGIGVGATIEGLSLHDLLDQFEIPHGVAPDAPVHFGGPVDPRRGFVVHSSDWSGQDTIDVAGSWSLSSTVDVLRAIAEGSGPTRYLVALGYAGWGGGQIEGELTQPGWFHVAGDEDLLFDTPAGRRWTAAFGKAGIDTRLLVPDAGTA